MLPLAWHAGACGAVRSTPAAAALRPWRAAAPPRTRAAPPPATSDRCTSPATHATLYPSEEPTRTERDAPVSAPYAIRARCKCSAS